MDLPLRDVSGVFAYLPFGGWDSSPSPEAMLSIARYWFERDDAYPAVIASDFIEFYTPVPVTTRRDAEILAVEHTMVSSAMPVRVYRARQARGGALRPARLVPVVGAAPGGTSCRAVLNRLSNVS